MRGRDALVVVTGASGRLGTEICVAFRKAGYRVAGVIRGASGATDLDETLRIECFSKVPAPSRPPAAVIHAAAESRDPSRMVEVNVRGCEQMLEWAATYGSSRFIHISSIGVYGPHRRGTITPHTPYAPADEYERTKAAAEAEVRKAAAAGRLGTTVIQPGMMFGAGPRWELPLLGFIRSVVNQRFIHVGSDEARFNYVDVRDVAAACVAALSPEAAGETFIVNDPLSVREAVETIASAAHVPAPRRRMPYAVAWLLAAGTQAAAAAVRRRGPLDLTRLQHFTTRTIYDGSPIRSRLGFVYPVGTRRGLADLVHHYRARSLL